jgi:formate dehydrogenase subunit gamma
MAIVHLPRFTLTERAAHWLVAVTFGVMLLTGTMVPHHWSVSDLSFDVHVGSAVVLVCGVGTLVFAANRRALGRTLRDLTTAEEGDGAWLRGAPVRALQGGAAPPAGRFNAGQKVNFLLVGLGLAALYGTGIALIFGHGPQGLLHHLAAIAMVVLITGHIYMAVINPGTRPRPARDHARRGRRGLGRASSSPLG